MQFRLMLLMLLTQWAVVVSAGDIAMDVRQAGVDTENGGFFEIGIGYEYSSGLGAEEDGSIDQSSGVVVNIGGAYYFKGLFIEAAMESYDGLNLGYQLISTENWSVDLLASSLSGNFTADIESDDWSDDKKLVDRDSLYSGAGVRITRYLDDLVLQGRLVSDVYKDNGVRASARLGKNWQVRNWNLHGIVSYDYASAKTMEYLVGVTEEESTERFGAYSPDEGSAMSVEFGAAYPVSENIVWNTRLLHTQYSDEISDSPLILDDQYTGFRTTLNYVF